MKHGRKARGETPSASAVRCIHETTKAPPPAAHFGDEAFFCVFVGCFFFSG